MRASGYNLQGKTILLCKVIKKKIITTEAKILIQIGDTKFNAENFFAI